MVEIGDKPPVRRPKDIPDPRERFSIDKLGDLLAAFGNHEAKAITLLAMRGGENAPIYTQRNLAERVLEIQGDEPGWKPESKSYIQFCQLSLAPIGLVVKEIIDPEKGTVGYKITEEGEEAKHLAGLLLDFSDRHNEISLLELFGQTPSAAKKKEQEEDAGDGSRKRAPLIRYQIYNALISHEGPMREEDLAQLVGEKEMVVGSHLKALKKLGRIEYDSTSQGSKESVAFYIVNPEKINEALLGEPDFRYRAFLREVYEVIQAGGISQFDRESVYQAIIKKNPKRTEQDKKNLANMISGCLSYLTSHEYITRVQFHQGKQSEISLTPQQRGFFEELVAMMEGFRIGSPEVSDYADGAVKDFMRNPHKVARLMKKAKEHSYHADEIDVVELRNHIILLTQKKPGITTAQLQSELKALGIKKSTQRISKVAREMEQDGVLSSEKEGLRKHLFLSEKVEESRELEPVTN